MKELKFGVIGHPIAHTMSPFIHSRLFQLSGIQADYEVYDIPPDSLESSMEQLRTLDGFNITIPHKQAIIPLLDGLDAKAEFFHSVNTVKNEAGLHTGHTTDGIGFTKALEAAGVKPGCRTLLLGCGGAARVIAFETVLAAREPDLTIAVRDHAKEDANRFLESLAELLRKQGKKFRLCQCTYEELECESSVTGKYAPPPFDLLVNGTPVGMHPKVGVSPVSKAVVSRCAAVFDAVYNPDETELLRIARSLNKTAVHGMAMLVWQAVAAHEIWDGSTYRAEDINQLCSDAIVQMQKLFGGAE